VAEAAEEIAIAGCFNAGQNCTAATRVLAAPGVHDDFVDALTEQARGQTGVIIVQPNGRPAANSHSPGGHVADGER
jgi:acyl-CoA reductase-like NAD-dependent aldehyde dehydrogenase